MHWLILGGARSGKSRFAEQLAITSQLPVTYFATARAEDGEMQERITHHRQDRPAEWPTVEEPLYLAQALKTHDAPNTVMLVDCLTLWLTNLLLLQDEDSMQTEILALKSVLNTLQGHVILVSNEVGLGIVPLGELSRRYVDEAGRLHQQLAAQCEQVTLVVAGLPHHLKGQKNGLVESTLSNP